MNIIPRLTVFTSLALFGLSPAMASDDLSYLKQALVDLSKRVEALEQENDRLKEAQETVRVRAQISAKPTPAARIAKQPTSYTLKGDLRYRYEGFEVDGKDDRSRNRVRSRINLVAKTPQNVELGIGIASGNDDPVSTNQSLGNGGSSKNVKLNLAYFKWSASDRLQLVGGKFKNVWHRPHKSELLWDSDYTPEGLALSYSSGDFYAHAAMQFLESDTKRSNARAIYGAQTGLKASTVFGKLNVGLGFYDAAVSGETVVFGSSDDFSGNTSICPDLATDCFYRHDYRIGQLFAELSRELAGQKFSVYGEYAKNRAVDDQDVAWSAGFKIGQAERLGSLALDYRYQVIESDAVLGLLTGSDFGNGGTDSQGHILKGSVGINKFWKLSLTYFNNEQDIEQEKTGYERIQIDSQFKF